MNQPTGQPTMLRTGVRRAVEADLPELVRLRALLFETLGGEYFNPAPVQPVQPDRNDWRHNLTAVLKEQLTADTARILVVDAEHGLAACGIGTVEQWFPGPHNLTGRVGHVIGVVTDPAHRRRGHSRAIMRALLDWFRAQDASRVDLYASTQGEPLYRDLGFVDHPDPALYWRPAHR
ncbi:GNAT family N-acetyltransferase [Streptomyces atriruber]|uniref:GNAT family N-acetyltransferase n=1 Tax=Streptomyces atriruber TaxID=545121 RepID=UPI000A8995BA|nr:GNAT family N-acetyltransferase [Streptomyces atriruber]